MVNKKEKEAKNVGERKKERMCEKKHGKKNIIELVKNMSWFNLIFLVFMFFSLFVDNNKKYYFIFFILNINDIHLDFLIGL